MKGFLSFLAKYLRKEKKPTYWYILYEDNTVDGGLIHFSDIWTVATIRRNSGRKNFQIVNR